MAPAHSPMVPHVHELTAFQVPFRTSLILPHPLPLHRIDPNRLASLHLDAYVAVLDCGNGLCGRDEYCCGVRLLRQCSRYVGQLLLQVDN